MALKNITRFLENKDKLLLHVIIIKTLFKYRVLNMDTCKYNIYCDMTWYTADLDLDNAQLMSIELAILFNVFNETK